MVYKDFTNKKLIQLPPLQDRDKILFDLLKQKIVVKMQQEYPGINPAISEWKGQEITDFQEELLAKINANISEKWFYNHMKSQNLNLPRIDVLNLLCRYAGNANWDDFVFSNSDQVHLPKIPPSANRYFIVVPLLLIGLLFAFYLIFRMFTNIEYCFSFYDSDTKESIIGNQIEMKLLQNEQSTLNFLSDSNGLCRIKTDQSVIKIVISAPYFKTDTILRVLKKFDKEQKIGLHINDYALIIHYFSEKNVEDWHKRRASLDTIFDDGARIYQVMISNRNVIGTELYNKQEFIDKLTMPTGSLKHIEILDTKFRKNKIMVLRFKINENSHE